MIKLVSSKIIFGYPDFKANDPTLLKIKSDQDNTVYINKVSIIFMKEL